MVEFHLLTFSTTEFKTCSLDSAASRRIYSSLYSCGANVSLPGSVGCSCSISSTVVVIPFILDVRLVDVPAGVTDEAGHTEILIHLPSAVLALIFLVRRITITTWYLFITITTWYSWALLLLLLLPGIAGHYYYYYYYLVFIYFVTKNSSSCESYLGRVNSVPWWLAHVT